MWLAGGSFVMDEKARAAMGGFLSRFGEFVELHHGGETLYLFNCTNVIDCLDESRTERVDGDQLVMEAIDESGDPPPGNTVMWRGLTRLTDIVLGMQLAAETCG